MSQRIDYDHIAPAAVRAVAQMSAYLRTRSIDDRLRALLEVRISQINGCSYCIDLHAQQARAAGETQQRLDLLSVWDEVPFFSEREKAALGWAESVTLVADTGIPDDDYDDLRELFSEEEIVDLTMIVIAMNAWNRLAIGFRKLPAERRENEGASN